MDEDDFFGGDPFEGILRDFLGGVPGRRVRRQESSMGEEEERNIDIIEAGKKVFLIFELPGYEEKDLELEIKNNIINVEVKKREECKVQDYLSRKLCKGIKARKALPNFIDLKSQEHSFSNGILEVSFNKK